eukprot:2406373-Pyramimonas_sp.AAC.1
MHLESGPVGHRWARRCVFGCFRPAGHPVPRRAPSGRAVLFVSFSVARVNSTSCIPFQSDNATVRGIWIRRLPRHIPPRSSTAP